jgi:hypothetical protein
MNHVVVTERDLNALDREGMGQMVAREDVYHRCPVDVTLRKE